MSFKKDHLTANQFMGKATEMWLRWDTLLQTLSHLPTYKHPQKSLSEYVVTNCNSHGYASYSQTIKLGPRLSVMEKSALTA